MENPLGVHVLSTEWLVKLIDIHHIHHKHLLSHFHPKAQRKNTIIFKILTLFVLFLLSWL